MNILLIHSASGDSINGATIRVPPGNYIVEKFGEFSNCLIYLNGGDPVPLSSKIILSAHSSLRINAFDAKDLTIKLHKEN